MGVGMAPVVLGIETSCDETGIGIAVGRSVRANTVASSMEEHARFGGVVPEIASRAHIAALASTVSQALAEAEFTMDDIDAFAVTAGPGLSGALMVGLAAAKGLAAATGKPLYGVNHLAAHVGVALLRAEADAGSHIALLVSGGHTELLRIDDILEEITLLGATIDDAAGEAFDKTARLLGLGYPGGPAIAEASTHGNPHAVPFPRGLTSAKDMANPNRRYSFSFSGLKTAARRCVENHSTASGSLSIADIAASFQAAIVDVCVQKTLLACEDTGIRSVILGGGVAANRQLRESLSEACAEAGITLTIPPLNLCTDNGAMVALLGAEAYRRGKPPSALELGTDSSAEVEHVIF